MKAASHSVGLGGDGDEIAAIGEVERAFGVKLDYTDAHEWSTAGDVYAALLRALPASEADQPGVWERFAIALCEETGVSPSSLSLDSELLSEPGLWVSVTKVSAVVWTIVAIAAVAGIGWLLL